MSAACGQGGAVRRGKLGSWEVGKLSGNRFNELSEGRGTIDKVSSTPCLLTKSPGGNMEIYMTSQSCVST
jgi:hypothetical protein